MQHYLGVLLTSQKPPADKISPVQYQAWKKTQVFDCLTGIRFGQSFCNRFDIEDALLYYSITDQEKAENYIRKNYLQ